MTGNHIGNHLHTCHKNVPAIQVDLAKISDIVAEYNLLQEMPIIHGPVAQFHGLTLWKDYVKCPECGAIYSRESLRSHYSRHHVSKARPNNLPGIFAQQLNQGANKRLFQVIPYSLPTTSIPISSPNLIIQNLRSRRNDLIEKYSSNELDARAISPWLLSTGWHIHTQPYKAEELCKLVAIPKGEGRLDKLGPAVQSLFEHAYRILSITNILVLQKLNTADPMKGG